VSEEVVVAAAVAAAAIAMAMETDLLRANLAGGDLRQIFDGPVSRLLL
jgi:hypothetical protein